MAAKKKTVAALSREIAKLRKELAKHKASDKKIHSAAKRQRVSPQALSTIRDVNVEGLTFLEWLRAAGVVQPRETHRQAWVSGEDPADWRAAGSPKMRGPKVRVVPEVNFIHPCCGGKGKSARSAKHKAGCRFKR